jgi:hypothetical protein
LLKYIILVLRSFAGCAPAPTYFFHVQKVSKNTSRSIQLTENYCYYISALALFSQTRTLSRKPPASCFALNAYSRFVFCVNLIKASHKGELGNFVAKVFLQAALVFPCAVMQARHLRAAA